MSEPHMGISLTPETRAEKQSKVVELLTKSPLQLFYTYARMVAIISGYPMRTTNTHLEQFRNGVQLIDQSNNDVYPLFRAGCTDEELRSFLGIGTEYTRALLGENKYSRLIREATRSVYQSYKVLLIGEEAGLTEGSYFQSEVADDHTGQDENLAAMSEDLSVITSVVLQVLLLNADIDQAQLEDILAVNGADGRGIPDRAIALYSYLDSIEFHRASL